MKARMTLWVIAAFIVPSTVFGIASEYKSACVQQKGHAYISTMYWNYCADKFWNASGQRRSAHNDFEKHEINVRIEYGLTHRDTLSMRSAWAKIDESINGRTFGFEDIEIGWKHCLGTKWCHLISTELVTILPTETEHKPGLRYGQFGGELNLLFSRGFSCWERYGNYDLRIGYRGYEGFPSDQVRADAAINLYPLSRLKLTASGHLEYGLFNGKSRSDESLFLLNPNYRLFRGQIQATVCVHKGASVFVGYQRHLWGRNVGTGGGVFGGAQIQF